MHTVLTVSYSNIYKRLQFFILMKSHLTFELASETILRLKRAFTVRGSVRYLNCNLPLVVPRRVEPEECCKRGFVGGDEPEKSLPTVRTLNLERG